MKDNNTAPCPLRLSSQKRTHGTPARRTFRSPPFFLLLFCYMVAIINNIRDGGLTFVPFGDNVNKCFSRKRLRKNDKNRHYFRISGRRKDDTDQETADGRPERSAGRSDRERIRGDRNRRRIPEGCRDRDPRDEFRLYLLLSGRRFWKSAFRSNHQISSGPYHHRAVRCGQAVRCHQGCQRCGERGRRRSELCDDRC